MFVVIYLVLTGISHRGPNHISFITGNQSARYREPSVSMLATSIKCRGVPNGTVILALEIVSLVRGRTHEPIWYQTVHTSLTFITDHFWLRFYYPDNRHLTTFDHPLTAPTNILTILKEFISILPEGKPWDSKKHFGDHFQTSTDQTRPTNIIKTFCEFSK